MGFPYFKYNVPNIVYFLILPSNYPSLCLAAFALLSFFSFLVLSSCFSEITSIQDFPFSPLVVFLPQPFSITFSLFLGSSQLPILPLFPSSSHRLPFPCHLLLISTSPHFLLPSSFSSAALPDLSGSVRPFLLLDSPVSIYCLLICPAGPAIMFCVRLKKESTGFITEN